MRTTTCMYKKIMTVIFITIIIIFSINKKKNYELKYFLDITLFNIVKTISIRHFFYMQVLNIFVPTFFSSMWQTCKNITWKWFICLDITIHIYIAIVIVLYEEKNENVVLICIHIWIEDTLNSDLYIHNYATTPTIR